MIVDYWELVVDLSRSWKVISCVIGEHVNYCPHEPVLVLEDEENWDFLSPVELGKHMP